MLYHGGFLPEDYGAVRTVLPRRRHKKKKRKPKSGCASLSKIKKGKAQRRYRKSAEGVMRTQRRVGTTATIASTGAAITGTVATLAPPWSTVVAIIPGLITVGQMASSALMGRRARILAGDPAMLKKFIKRYKKRSPNARKRLTARFVRRYKRHCARGSRFVWLGIGKRKIKERRFWRVREARLRMKLTALFLANRKRKKGKKKPDLEIVQAPVQPLPPPDYTGIVLVGGAVIIATSIYFSMKKKAKR